MVAITCFQYSDFSKLRQASDILGASEKPVLAVILSADDQTVTVDAKDKNIALRLLDQAGLSPDSVQTRQANDDERAILNYVSDAPNLDQDWSDYEQAASYGL